MNNRSNVLKIKDIYEFLNSISPFELQEKWDNSGLLVGNMSDSFESLYLSMDLDLDLVKNLKPNSLVITHHPLIFSGLKRVNYDTYSTKILKELIKKDIALISMHTNIDKTHLNRFVVEKILNFKIENQNEFIANVKIDMSFSDLLKYLSKKLNWMLYIGYGVVAIHTAPDWAINIAKRLVQAILVIIGLFTLLMLSLFIVPCLLFEKKKCKKAQ